MNTRASRTIVTQSVPKVSSSAAGFARTTAACAHAGMQPRRLHPDAHRAGAGAGGGDQLVEFAHVFDEAAPWPFTRREIGSSQRDDIDVAFVSRGRGHIHRRRDADARELRFLAEQPRDQRAERHVPVDRARVAGVEILTQREHRRQIDERDELIDGTLARRMAGMRIDERTAGSRRRKGDAVAGPPVRSSRSSSSWSGTPSSPT